ncbi:hypothetical protein D3C86_1411720 [compost metagenome]
MPACPLFVVIRTPPFAPRAPYTAAEAASFSTVTLAISLGSILLIERSTPSTRTNAPLSPNVLCPLIKNVGSSNPGFPLRWAVITPVIFPAKEFAKLGTGALVSAAPSKEEIAPDTSDFFCVP